jgi:hypothetical protein
MPWRANPYWLLKQLSNIISGDISITPSGVVTVTKVNGHNPIAVADGGTGRSALSTFTTTTGNPTGVTGTTPLMLGMGSVFKFTPNGTSAVISISGQLTNSTANGGTFATLRYGTGVAPVNGAAATGTNTVTQATSTSPVNVIFPAMLIAAISGLTPGVQIWFDLSLQALVGGTLSGFVNPSATAWDL